jgi:hypothetical protein
VGEKLVASRAVTVDRQHLDVLISRHSDEQFITSAVAGEGSAWESLARVGHRHFSPPIW